MRFLFPLLVLTHTVNGFDQDQIQTITRNANERQQSDLHAYLKKQLHNFYNTHNPEKINKIDKILSVFSGDEREIWKGLQEKYPEHKEDLEKELNGMDAFKKYNDDLVLKWSVSDESSKKRWCCLYDWNFVEDTCDGGTVFFKGSAYQTWPIDWTFERTAMVWITGVTNLAFIPSLVRSHKNDNIGESIVGLATMITSGLYHTAESIHRKLFGMDAGAWHRLDNTFAIASFCNLFLMLCNFESQRTRETMQWVVMIVILILMEYNPWAIGCTIGPVVGCIVPFAFVIYKNVPYRQALWNQETKRTLFFLVCALTCFKIGLDEDNDYLRMWHGGWHLFVGVFSYFSQGIVPAALESMKKSPTDNSSAKQEGTPTPTATPTTTTTSTSTTTPDKNTSDHEPGYVPVSPTAGKKDKAD